MKMRKNLSLLTFFCGLLPGVLYAAEQGDYDYFAANRLMIRNGVQAVLTCNGLFTSHRTLEQVYEQELAYLVRLGGQLGSAQGGEYRVDDENKAVAVGGAEEGPVMTAAFREGIGCIIMAPDQGIDDIASLPVNNAPQLSGRAAEIPWPNGDLIAGKPLPPLTKLTWVRPPLVTQILAPTASRLDALPSSRNCTQCAFPAWLFMNRKGSLLALVTNRSWRPSLSKSATTTPRPSSNESRPCSAATSLNSMPPWLWNRLLC
jgi:hypothetical protein